MRRPPIIPIIVILLLLIGGVIFLSTQAQEVPVRTIETEVSAGGDAR